MDEAFVDAAASGGEHGSSDVLDGGDETNDSEARALIERDRAELKAFADGLSVEDIKSGNWFVRLLSLAMDSYTENVNWEYFQRKYEGVPADGIVDQRIKMASRYAALEGGLSASAYSAAIVSTLGSAGGASALTVPAAVTTVMVDVAYVTQLQLRLAYDIAVLYGVPIDSADPDAMWKLIRVALSIKSGEAVRESTAKVVPVLMRPFIKRYYKGSVLAAAKSLPVVGRHLLQRNAIKIGIPLVGVPLAVLLNRYTTMVAGRHAIAVFRNEARVIEVAEQLTEDAEDASLRLWVAWFIIMADGKRSDDETLLMRHMARLLRERHQVVDEELARVIDFDADDLWRRLEGQPGDHSSLVDVARRVATVDGAVNAREEAAIAALRQRCG